MEGKKELHVARLEDGLKQIEAFRQVSQPVPHGDVRNWKERVQQSLRELFGPAHEYVGRFSRLTFFEFRVILNLSGGSGGRPWGPRDREKFEGDLRSAEKIIRDALEELQVYSLAAETAEPKGMSARMAPSVTVNINNVLSQTIEVRINQVLETINELYLPEEAKHEAATAAKAFDEEANGGQRWPVLAKSLDALKALGKPVYEKVAIPLLMEMLKKQMGL